MTGDGWGGDFVRWGLGGAAILALHIGAGYWVVQAAERGDMAGVPEPIMIDLAPAPEPAPAASEGAEAEPGEAESEAEPEPAPEPEPEPEPAPDFTPPDLPELPPVEDFSDLIPEPVAAPDFEVPPLTELPPITDFSELLPDSALLLSASQRPMSRPVRREPEPEPQQQQARREEPRQESQRRERQESRQPEQAQARQAAPARQGAAERQQASGGGSGQPQGSAAPSARQMASWQSRVASRIAAHMSRTRVPGARGGTVNVQVRISLSGGGAASAQLVSSTGNGDVDQALARQAARMPNLPAPPDGQAKSFVLPIQVQLR